MERKDENMTAIALKLRKKAPDAVATLCAVFMLCVIPLLYHDAFFDINRYKVKAVCRVLPVLAALMLAALAADPQRRKRLSGLRDGGMTQLAMLMLMIACIVSCALAGFDEDVLTGSKGRYCGLYFMLCCMAAFFIMSTGHLCFRALMPAILLCAAAIAALGFANAIGYDPLGFYARIKKGQEPVFLSTIGNFDFYGTFLVMMLSLSGAQAVFSPGKGMRALGFACAVMIEFGATASRTDSAFAGMHLACFLLFALSGGRFDRMARALALWGICFLSLPLTYALLEKSIYSPAIAGLPKILYEMYAAWILAAVLLALAAVCLLLMRRGATPPGRKRLLIAMLCLFALGVLLLAAAIVYFSVFNTRARLGGAASFLRFNDRWGSLRGFAYIRSLRAFADYDLQKKLFGAGMERTLSVLKPYFDNPDMLKYGVFNDPHCQLLQMLLTCGLFGMIAFALLYVSALCLFFRHAGEDPVLCGVLCAIWSYIIILLINVTQPILIATYFSICGLGLSRIRTLKDLRGGQACEP